jgi:hypothetical protein
VVTTADEDKRRDVNGLNHLPNRKSDKKVKSRNG